MLHSGACMKMQHAICTLNKRQIDQAERGLITGTVLLAAEKHFNKGYYGTNSWFDFLLAIHKKKKNIHYKKKS